jgi:hypothetical protein
MELDQRGIDIITETEIKMNGKGSSEIENYVFI